MTLQKLVKSLMKENARVVVKEQFTRMLAYTTLYIRGKAFARPSKNKRIESL